jgi:hypothetical protein
MSIKTTNVYPFVAFLLIYALQFCFRVKAFHTASLRLGTSRLVVPVYGVIRPESVDFDFDVGQGGVRLAEESVIKVTGKVTHKPGNAEPIISELLRYTQLTQVSEQIAVEFMNQNGVTILAAGRGMELYKNPGSTTEQIILHGPTEAVRDALIGAKSAMQASNIVINFCGGEDAQVLEVLSAIKKMVLDLDVATKAKISFNSISHSTFPLGSSAVTVVAIPLADESSEGATGVGSQSRTQEAFSSGEIYFRDGIFYTVLDEHINTAIA